MLRSFPAYITLFYFTYTKPINLRLTYIVFTVTKTICVMVILHHRDIKCYDQCIHTTVEYIILAYTCGIFSLTHTHTHTHTLSAGISKAKTQLQVINCLNPSATCGNNRPFDIDLACRVTSKATTNCLPASTFPHHCHAQVNIKYY